MGQEEHGSVSKPKRKLAVALLIIIGSCCILQSIAIGVINLIRGYSIAGYWSFSVFLVGYLIFGVVLVPIYKKKPAASFFSLTGSFLMIGVCLISIFQGKYQTEAKGYYEACQYQQALQACQKEAQTWYHLLRYNYHERTAMNLMAETYCQLEDFDSARDTYKLMIDRYAGEYYGDRARENLKKLEEGLEVVAYYPDRIAESPLPDYMRKQKYNLDPKHKEAMVLYDIALKYMHDLNCHAKAHEVYIRIIATDVPEEMKKSAYTQILKLKAAGELE